MNRILKAGDIVRYDSGSTALARLIAPHVDGWYARQYFGSVIVVCDKPFRKIRRASNEEVNSYLQAAKEWEHNPHPWRLSVNDNIKLTFPLTTVIGNVTVTLDEKPRVMMFEVNNRRVYAARIRVKDRWYTGEALHIEIAVRQAAVAYHVGLDSSPQRACDIAIVRKRCY